MMRDVASTLLANKDLQSLSGSEVEGMASALGGFAPSQLQKIPDSAVLNAFHSIKENKALNRKQVY